CASNSIIHEVISIGELVLSLRFLVLSLPRAAAFLQAKRCFPKREIIRNPLQEAECDSLADLIMSGKSYLTHSTSKTIGIERTKADDITGEAIEELMPNQQITPEYEKLGFAECISKYDYYSSDISFADQFKPLVQATPKKKKFKHKKFKNSGGTS
nr:hypothetical protein [Ruminococcus sp.]